MDTGKNNDVDANEILSVTRKVFYHYCFFYAWESINIVLVLYNAFFSVLSFK